MENSSWGAILINRIFYGFLVACFINNNAISINGNKVCDVDIIIDDSYFIDNKYIIVKRGKKNYYIGVLDN